MSDPKSDAFSRSGAILVMLTILVVWSNHSNKNRVLRFKNRLQQHKDVKESYPAARFKKILSNSRITEENDGKSIIGSINDGAFQSINEDLKAKNTEMQANIDNTLNSFEDEISVGTVISSNIKKAELAGGLAGTFIWGFGDIPFKLTGC